MAFNEDDVILNIHKLPSELINEIFSYIPACGFRVFLSYPRLARQAAKYMLKKVVIMENIKPHPDTKPIICDLPRHNWFIFNEIKDLLDFCFKYDVWPEKVIMSPFYLRECEIKLFKSYESISLSGFINGEEEYEAIRKKLDQLNIYGFNFKFPDDSFNPEFVGTFPKSLRNLYVGTDELLGDEPVFKQFQFLENLSLRYASVDLLQYLPPSLSKLETDQFYVDNDPDPTAPVLPCLKTFVPNTVFYEENYTLEPVFRQMPNLKTFLARETSIPNLADLHLPTSLTFMFLSNIKTFQNFTQYENLRELGLFDCEFPVEAFKDANTFPNMIRFGYFGHGRPWITVDNLVFPKNLRFFQIQASISIEKWTLPKSLRRLELRGIDVGEDFEFNFPSGIYHLEIIDTQLQGLDDVMFPSELAILRIMKNEHLRSMYGTNINYLERLLHVEISGNRKLDMDESDESD